MMEIQTFGYIEQIYMYMNNGYQEIFTSRTPHRCIEANAPVSCETKSKSFLEAVSPLPDARRLALLGGWNA